MSKRRPCERSSLSVWTCGGSGGKDGIKKMGKRAIVTSQFDSVLSLHYFIFNPCINQSSTKCHSY